MIHINLIGNLSEIPEYFGLEISYDDPVTAMVVILGIFIMVFSGVSFIPAAIVYRLMKSRQTEMDANFSATYFGTWGGGMVFILLFLFQMDLFYPIIRLLGMMTTLVLMGLTGCFFGGWMGFSFLAKKKNGG